ncbi:HEAT repeat domain-containing protein [Gammaproteobacteria bacterium]
MYLLQSILFTIPELLPEILFMALVKKGISSVVPDQRGGSRDLAGLLEQIDDNSAEVRRWAALDLGDFPDSAARLCTRLEQETQPPVREAIFTSLIRIGGHPVVKGLLPLLRSDDAAIRNGAIDTLQRLPEALAPYMEIMLRDPDSDYRIFAINIMTNLRHPRTPEWLRAVIERDRHINVCAAAVELMAEVGSPEDVAILASLPERFDQDPFLHFATEIAIRRIHATRATP